MRWALDGVAIALLMWGALAAPRWMAALFVLFSAILGLHIGIETGRLAHEYELYDDEEEDDG